MSRLGHPTHKHALALLGMKKILAVALSLLMVWQLFGYDFPLYASTIALALSGEPEQITQPKDGSQALTSSQGGEYEQDEATGGLQGINGSHAANAVLDAQSVPDSKAASDDDSKEGAQSDSSSPSNAGSVADATSESKADADAKPDSGSKSGSSSNSESDNSSDSNAGSDEKAGFDSDSGSGLDEDEKSQSQLEPKGDTQGEESTDTVGGETDEEEGAEDSSDGADEEAPLPDVIRDGYIHIATTAQLKAIGTDDPVTTSDLEEGGFGSGEAVEDADGNAVTYATDAEYYLDNDIELPGGGAWNLPEGFAGSFSGPADADPTRIYDPGTDTIYIQNPYQLDILSSEGRDEMPVMTGDVAAETFGTGSMVFPDGEQRAADAGDEGPEASGFITYDESHTYVLSAAFTEERGELTMLAAAHGLRGVQDNADLVDGRDYFGQVTKEIGGTTYILIGDRQQLDAINSDATTRTNVCKPVFKATEGTVEVWRTSAHVFGDWIWLSEFDGSKDLRNGNGYGTTAAEVLASYQNLISSAEVVYPGDADLVGDFAQSPLFGVDSSGYHKLDRPAGTATGAGSSRDVYFTTNDTTGLPDITTATLTASDPTAGSLKYTKNGNYIVFRDIDMTKGDASQVGYGTLANGDWKPLMFTGNMYGVKAASSSAVGTIDQGMQTLLSGGSLSTATQRPTISNFTVVPQTRTQLSSVRLDLNTNEGVGFFGTITGKFNDSEIITEPSAVINLRIADGEVNNNCVQGQIDTSVISGLLSGLGWVVGGVLDVLLKALTGKDNFTVQDMLTSLLNAREKDPTSLATGAFAGRILSDTTVRDCEVSDVTVSTVVTNFEQSGDTTGNASKLVGTGGFVGHVEGETRYEGLSGLLGGLVTVLSGLLNIIPGLGLGDLITVLLDNALDVGRLIPTGYTAPHISGCTADAVVLTNPLGKVGVGGFAGDVVGTRVEDCTVRNTTTDILADSFGGGFVGIGRDAIIEATLSGLNVDVLQALHPQTEFIGCSIEDSDLSVGGRQYLGGFTGCLANSYVIEAAVDEQSSLNVSGTGDYVSGFCGRGQLGTLFTMSDYLPTSADLLGTVTGLVTQLVGSSTDQTLLDVGGVAPAALVGVRVLGPVSVSSEGSYVGGLVGRGDGIYVIASDDIASLPKYSGSAAAALPSGVQGCDNRMTHLVSVQGDQKYVGGLAGYLTSANVGGLLGSTVGLGQFLGFTVSDTTISGDEADGGYAVSAGEDYAAGGVGWAVGGSIEDVDLLQLSSVTAGNHAAGFVGATGPGDLVSGEGLDLTLLGLNLVSVDNLLSLVSGVRTTYERANVSGIADGFTVEATGQRAGTETTDYLAGGWAAEANSVHVVDSHVRNLLSVTASMNEGRAGGYVGDSSAGGLAGVATDETGALKLLSLSNLLDAVPYLIPSYDGCSTTYVDGGYVQADTAGGFAGEFRSGKVNTYATKIEDGVALAYGWNPISDQPYTLDHAAGYSCGSLDDEPWSVYNLDHVRGGAYAGGWGGNVYSGALASAGEGLSLLGGNGLSLDGLVNVAQAYVPIIYCAGVQGSQTGFQVFAAHEEQGGQPATAGKAGGYIGYGSGVEVSYSDVDHLRSGQPKEPTSLTGADNTAYSRIGMAPDALESQDGSNYMDFGDFDADPRSVPYAVAGVTHAGGYIGHMDVGSAASVGDKLSLLSVLNLSDVLSALNSVVSTIEHSDVVETPGGYSVVASSHINLGDGAFDDEGVGYAGGYVGQAEGGHIQDGNSYNFYYVIGEIAAGGYAGEIIPGSVADVLGDNASANLGRLDILDASGLLSLAQDFVPTIRNSETTCVPCGGAVRAEKPSDGSGTQGTAAQLRGMAGGYVGHNKGGQIWGMDHRRWKDVDDYPLGTVPIATAGPRECAAIRIRSVYGAEYAGGFCGLMECASTAESGGLSLLGGLVKLDNLIGALQAVYPTIEAGAVYGPLYGMKDFSEATWNAWRKNIAAYGGFASELAGMSYQQMLNADWSQYVYGTNIVAGRHEYDPHVNTSLAGCAGGFVGSMHGGAISGAELVDELEIDAPCHAEDVKLVLGMRAAGGFAGEMQTKGLAEAGSASVLGIPLNLGNLLGLAQVFVPAISTSGTKGYQKGLRVGATGQSSVSTTNDSAAYAANIGCAGGYVGACYGGQIGISDSTSNIIIDAVSRGDVGGAWVRMLKEVKGTRDIGGFVGRTSSASVVNADTEAASAGFLQSLLNSVASSPNDLLDVLQATVATIKYAKVSASDPKWGIVVDGTYRDDAGNTAYAETAGGFAGSLEAAVIGERNNELDVITLDGLRSVVGGRYAGGFFGLADVGSVADVGGSGGTSVLNNLVKAGNISALDAFRTYVYRAHVTGVSDGIRVYAKDDVVSHGTMSTYAESGAAGGFGGALLNGTVEHSSTEGLNYVEAPNYAAGFVGHAGKNGGVTADEVSLGNNNSLLSRLVAVLGLDLSAAAKLFDIVGSTITDCLVMGFDDGFITKTTNEQTPGSTGQTQDNITGSCSAGFVGFADAAQIDECGARRYKLAQGTQIAAGFVGRTSVAYLADVDVDLTLVRGLLSFLDTIGVMDILYGVSSLIPAIRIGDSEFKLLSEGSVLYLDLFGFKLGVSLVRAEAGSGEPDSLTIVLGSSTITVPYSRDLNDVVLTESDASIQLIEGNRTSIKNSYVKGVYDGYDVFGGNAGQSQDGSGGLGYAGGFVGYNDNGFFSHNKMILCDVVRGTQDEVGPFVGSGAYATRSQEYLEGTDNIFRIYRKNDGAYTGLQTRDGAVFNTSFARRNATDTGSGTTWDRYEVTHYDVIKQHDDLRNARYAGTSTDPEAYVSAAKAKLMDDVPATPNGTGNTIEPDDLKDPCDELFDLTINKKWEGDLAGLTGTRPDNITVYVWQVDVGTRIPETLVAEGLSPIAGRNSIAHTYELQLNAEANAQTHTEAWKAQLKDLPVAHMVTVPLLDGNGDPVPVLDEQGNPLFELDELGEPIPVVDDEGEPVLDGEGNPTYQVRYQTEEELHYYRYYVSEVQVSRYTTTYELVQDTASVNITNTYDGGLLPYLGGLGDGGAQHAIAMVLAAVLLALSAWHVRRLRRKGGGRVNA